ncbi:MAG: glycosyltransferase WbuB [Calditrichaeota bacterium]|nr:MAG: glycosyltransferase WbuB [Calditrichota bacterium]
MHIMLNDYGGYAFSMDLAEALAQRGHEVSYLFSSASASPRGALTIEMPRLRVMDITIPDNQKDNLIKRRRAEKEYGHQSMAMVQKLEPHVVISTNVPLAALGTLFTYCKRKKIPFILWWQDALSLAMRSILSRKFGCLGALIGLYAEHWEKKIVRGAEALIVISPEFGDLARAWGACADRIFFIPNWAPVEKIVPLPKVNDFSRRWELTDKFVVLYSGTLGMKQNPQSIVDAAKYVRHDPDIKLVILSNGVAMPWLQQEKVRLQLENLLLLPLQSAEDVSAVLASGDVHLVLLQPDAGRYCVPSKVWSSFCAARPLLADIPHDNYAAKMIREIEAGVLWSADSKKCLGEKIFELKTAKLKLQSMGKNGRHYAEEHFVREKISNQFEFLLSRLCHSGGLQKDLLHAS